LLKRTIACFRATRSEKYLNIIYVNDSEVWYGSLLLDFSANHIFHTLHIMQKNMPTFFLELWNYDWWHGTSLVFTVPTSGEFVPRFGISATFGEKSGVLRNLAIF